MIQKGGSQPLISSKHQWLQSDFLWLLLVAGLLWVVTLKPLFAIWLTHADYAFGWSVPPLALSFLWVRWGDRASFGQGNVAGLATASSWALFVGLTAATLLLRVILEANPDWRLPMGLLVLCTFLGSIGLMALSGGGSLIRPSLFPLLFLFAAVPWPSALERDLIRWLSEANAALAVDMLRFGGVYVVREGHVLRTLAGNVGIEEACSGIRGLQAGLMFALAAGEIFRNNAWGRLLLAGLLAPLIAIGLNTARVLFLVAILAREGEAAIDVWHDGTGEALLLGQISLTLLLAWWLPKQNRCEKTKPHSFPQIGLPVRSGLALIFGLALCELVPHLWYALPDRIARENRLWQFTENPPPDAIPHEVSRLVRRVLAADTLLAYRSSPGQDPPWLLYALEWGSQNLHAIPARAHTPEVCLSARAGLQVRGEMEWIDILVKGRSLPFRKYQFHGAGREWTILFGSFEQRTRAEKGRAVASVPDIHQRFAWVWQRQRNRGYATIELAILGQPDPSTLSDLARRLIEGILIFPDQD